ncbi:Hypp3559 [Branchiostoma lanceolatum]|uniref:Hypp3559 protein n=1 Tax=Branchiostoma lanceolatum TaxID=7740 RepID=A0A8K0A016_BRALA|nr:Hypp3559 [Branchiostoma lanceolatum]
MTPVHFSTTSSEGLLLNGTTVRPSSGAEVIVPADDNADGSATYTTRYIAGVTTSGVLALGFILLCCHSAIKLKIWKPVDG